MDRQPPHPLQGKFQVVYLDFSRASGGSGSLEENFNNYCGMVMDLFGKVYEPYYFPGFAQRDGRTARLCQQVELPEPACG